MITKKCLYCGKEFRTHSCYTERGGNKYCSRKCFYKSRIGRKRPEHSEKMKRARKAKVISNKRWICFNLSTKSSV